MTEPTVEERLTALQAELDEARAEIERLTPLAEQGEQYHNDLVEQCIDEGIRANGDDFPADAYREILRGTSLENIKATLTMYAEQARKRFAGGRQTVDGDETEADPPNEPETVEISTTPAAAYAA